MILFCQIAADGCGMIYYIRQVSSLLPIIATLMVFSLLEVEGSKGNGGNNIAKSKYQLSGPCNEAGNEYKRLQPAYLANKLPAKVP